MQKITVEIEDTLQDHIDGAIDLVKDALHDFMSANYDVQKAPDIDRLDERGVIHEIIDQSVPIYTAEINDLFYLHGENIEQAFDDAGIGDKDDTLWPAGWKAAALYCYIDQKVREWYDENAQEVCDEWIEAHGEARE